MITKENNANWNAGWSAHFDKLNKLTQENAPVATLKTCQCKYSDGVYYQVRVQNKGWAVEHPFKTLEEATEFLKGYTS